MNHTLNILHLTDLHIGHNFYYEKNTDQLSIRIADELIKHRSEIDLILISGDIFDGRAIKKDNSNEDEIISLAVLFITKLIERLNKNPDKNKEYTIRDFLFLPGNHDLRRIDDDVYCTYKKFLQKLYTADEYLEYYNEEYLYSFRIYEDRKIIVLGLNSCQLEKEKFNQEELKWLEESSKISQKIKNELFELYRNHQQSKWHDFGEINLNQIVQAEDQLKDILGNSFQNYNIVVSFHHHIHLFPEIYSKSGDSSLIKNFEQVLHKLQLLNVKLVLHGHKHLPLISPVTNEDYLKNPNEILYVVSGGSIGSNEAPDRYFQLVKVFNKQEKHKVCQIKRFKFKLERSDKVENILLPPKEQEEKSIIVRLTKILETERPDLFKTYISKIEESDFVSREKRIDKIIESLSGILTAFKNSSEKIKDNPIDSLIIILFIHLRINSLFENSHQKDGTHKSLIPEIISLFDSICSLDDGFKKNVIKYLSRPIAENKSSYYDNIHKPDNSSNQKRIAAYASISKFFTDFYLVLSQYSDTFYKQIEHKINIKLEKGHFNQDIPSNYICFQSEPDRRSIIVQLKSKNPTSHKIEVLPFSRTVVLLISTHFERVISSKRWMQVAPIR